MMNNLQIFCISLSENHLEKIKEINYIPVGLGNEFFSKDWLRDNSGDNISEKNRYYGEYTFHYWLWKNNFMNIEEGSWIGFCTYRRFWSNKIKNTVIKNLKDSIIQNVPEEWSEYNSVLVEPLFISKTKFSKVLKHGKKYLLKNPLIFFDKKKITIKVHFDMYHGHGNLDKAIDLLDIQNREDFRRFVEAENMFNPYNMFLCKSKKILNEYYESVFNWLSKCENIFGFDMNNSYGSIRIYGFLAERYLSYWFKKNSKSINWPIHFYDISN